MTSQSDPNPPSKEFLEQMAANMKAQAEFISSIAEGSPQPLDATASQIRELSVAERREAERAYRQASEELRRWRGGPRRMAELVAGVASELAAFATWLQTDHRQLRDGSAVPVLRDLARRLVTVTDAAEQHPKHMAAAKERARELYRALRGDEPVDEADEAASTTTVPS